MDGCGDARDLPIYRGIRPQASRLEVSGGSSVGERAYLVKAETYKICCLNGNESHGIETISAPVDYRHAVRLTEA